MATVGRHPELGDFEFDPQGLDSSRHEERVRQVLRTMRRVGIWGASDNELRKSFRVARFLFEHGFTVLPQGDTALIAGLPAIANIARLEPPADVVAVFCTPADVMGVAQRLAESPPPAVWFQEGLMDPSAARLLEAAGKVVIMDRCVMRDYRRHVLGEEIESWFPV